MRDVALLGEPVVATDLAGILPVAFGIYLVTRPAKRLRLYCPSS